MGDRQLNPLVSGGDYDTVGEEAWRDYPELEGSSEHSDRLSAAWGAALDAGMSADDARKEARRAAGPGPSAADYATHFSKPEWQEVSQANDRIDECNDQKKSRLAAWKHGQTVNFRNDKCDGDPNMTA